MKSKDWGIVLARNFSFLGSVIKGEKARKTPVSPFSIFLIIWIFFCEFHIILPYFVVLFIGSVKACVYFTNNRLIFA